MMIRVVFVGIVIGVLVGLLILAGSAMADGDHCSGAECYPTPTPTQPPTAVEVVDGGLIGGGGSPQDMAGTVLLALAALALFLWSVVEIQK